MAEDHTDFLPAARLQSKAGICVYLGNISPSTYDKWAAKGIVPGPVSGTNRYDLRAHDLAIDRYGKLEREPVRQLSPLDAWEQGHAR